jgi:hypothetical protein
MLEREKLVLYNVLNNETVFAEYFCNLLSIDEFRNLFIKFISKKNLIFEKLNIEYENFDTEIYLDNEYGRADLFLKVDDKEFIFEIKNKERTGLTDKQPKSYLEYLKNNNQLNPNKQLFFLIPKYYKHKQDIKNGWNLFDKEFNEIENQFLYWEDFIYELKNNIEEQKTEIKIFYDFCMYWFNMKTVEFKGEEMELLKNKDLPKLMKKLESITVDIGLEVGFDDDFDIGLFSYSKDINDYRVYFGIDYDIWEEKKTPLSIFIKKTRSNSDFDLKIENISLEKIEWKESNISELEVGYVVIINDLFGSQSFELTVKNTINHIIKELKIKK